MGFKWDFQWDFGIFAQQLIFLLVLEKKEIMHEKLDIKITQKHNKIARKNQTKRFLLNYRYGIFVVDEGYPIAFIVLGYPIAQ